jgi:hypothetical protein
MSDMVAVHDEQLRVFEKAERTLNLTVSELEVVRHQHVRIQALLRFNEGKRAFIRGDMPVAVHKLNEANSFFKSRRIAFILLVLRFSPRFLLRAYHFRHRLLYGVNMTC